MNKKASKKCECDGVGKLQLGMEWRFDIKTELPYVNHEPNECKCTNELKLYKRKGKIVTLCSCCNLSSDIGV